MYEYVSVCTHWAHMYIYMYTCLGMHFLDSWTIFFGYHNFGVILILKFLGSGIYSRLKIILVELIRHL